METSYCRPGTQCPVPGTVEVDGQRFIYVQGKNIRSFSKDYRKMKKFYRSTKGNGGSAINNFEIEDPVGRKFFAVSYGGDDMDAYEAWNQRWLEGMSLLSGRIQEGKFVISTGQVFNLSECQFTDWHGKWDPRGKVGGFIHWGLKWLLGLVS